MSLSSRGSLSVDAARIEWLGALLLREVLSDWDFWAGVALGSESMSLFLRTLGTRTELWFYKSEENLEADLLLDLMPSFSEQDIRGSAKNGRASISPLVAQKKAAVRAKGSGFGSSWISTSGSSISEHFWTCLPTCKMMMVLTWIVQNDVWTVLRA